MFSNHRLLKVARVFFVAAGLLLASLTSARAQSSRASFLDMSRRNPAAAS